MGKSYWVTLCQQNYQINVLSNFICINLAALHKTSNTLVYILKIIGAETQAELEVLKGYQNITLWGARF